MPKNQFKGDGAQQVSKPLLYFPIVLKERKKISFQSMDVYVMLKLYCGSPAHFCIAAWKISRLTPDLYFLFNVFIGS